jgi:hypothetical protein
MLKNDIEAVDMIAEKIETEQWLPIEVLEYFYTTKEFIYYGFSGFEYLKRRLQFKFG